MSTGAAAHTAHGHNTDDPVDAIMSAAGYAVLAKMRWSTPDYVVNDIAHNMGFEEFDLDACAEAHTAKATRFISAEDDALIVPWRTWGGADNRRAFINPPWGARGVTRASKEAFPEHSLAPFPGTGAFVGRAWAQSREGMEVACLLPSSMDQWLKRWAALADEVWFGPRIRFINHLGVVGPQPSSAHMVLIFRPHVSIVGHPGGPRVRWDWSPRE